MTQSGYFLLKKHFDNHWTITNFSNGMENLRDTFKQAFNTPIGKFDIHTTRVRYSNNPINAVTTLIGNIDEAMPAGIIPCLDTIHCVSILDRKYLLGLTDDNVKEYMQDVFMAIEYIISFDRFYSESVGETSPYNKFLRMLPLYITYHHIGTVDCDKLDILHDTFLDWLEKYACDSREDAEAVLQSICGNKYCETFEKVYAIITCNGSIELFS